MTTELARDIIWVWKPAAVIRAAAGFVAIGTVVGADMARLFEVTCEEIRGLNDYQLTDLLRRLLLLEAKSHNIPAASVSVSMTIDAPDGGSDGTIEWSDGVKRTNYIPSRLCIFQVKATPMPPSKCANEVLQKHRKKGVPRELKPRVREVIARGGSYVLFCRNPHKVEAQVRPIPDMLPIFHVTWYATPEPFPQACCRLARLMHNTRLGAARRRNPDSGNIPCPSAISLRYRSCIGAQTLPIHPLAWIPPPGFGNPCRASGW